MTVAEKGGVAVVFCITELDPQRLLTAKSDGQHVTARGTTENKLSRKKGQV